VAVSKAKVSSFKGPSLSTAALSSITVKADDAAAALHLTQWIETNSMDDDSPPLVGEKEKRA